MFPELKEGVKLKEIQEHLLRNSLAWFHYVWLFNRAGEKENYVQLVGL